ncbi:T9SS C-terminal target domain-containing protein [Aquimarina sp. AD10]|uniref:T9SS type A sorting domain-containing protein n=1 Tax=Aquimarina sp. AD10 TaxID=1714849 RepID=UPI000E4E1FA8|nr:T9SS type A sorting domain-containing protein [Aquimarina sp. AD10]AXT60944.1 T9SS C-terminal target domain-containing protein [Aquimarina sp. AD10]
MKQIIYFIISLLSINSIKCQDLFLEDINGDKKADILSVFTENRKDFKIKQFYSGHKTYKFDYLNEFDFTAGDIFENYTVADIDGNGRSNFIAFADSNDDKNIWYYTIEANEIKYLGHTLLPNYAGTKQYFADIDGDSLHELILVKDEGSFKHINTFKYNGSDFIQIDAFATTGNPKEEHFADITGDGKDDLILSQDYGNDKRIWTFKSKGSTFEYLKYTLLASDAGKEVHFVNSNSEEDNRLDLALSGNTTEGKKIWMFLSDGERFHYEITTTLTDGTNRKLLFGDLDGTNKDDLIATNNTQDIWSYQNEGNVFTYKLHSPLNFRGTIPLNRIVDWNNAGYRGGESVPNSFNHFVQMPPPSDNPETNYANFETKLSEAVALKTTFPNEHIVIQFQAGSYQLPFNQQIVLDYKNDNHSWIVIQGQGIKSENHLNGKYTELVFNIDPEYSKYANHFINIRGLKKSPNGPGEIPPIVIDYKREANEITLDKPSSIPDGEKHLMEILFTNGKWHEQPNVDSDSIQPNEYTGLISSVIPVSNTTYKLKKDFSLAWEKFKDQTNAAKVYYFTAVEEIGIADLSLRYSDNFENSIKKTKASAIISINNARNCWVDNVEIEKVYSSGIEIGESEFIEVRNSYLHEAYGYGGGGRAYGVSVSSRSIHCKVENNVFRKLRHAMIAQDGSNNNVFGYNYSREQTDTEDRFYCHALGDLNLHGTYPYANLFEGNSIDRIFADHHWGPNGSYNTFFRNHINDTQINNCDHESNLMIKAMLYPNILGNEQAEIRLIEYTEGNIPETVENTKFQMYQQEYKIYDQNTIIKEYKYLPDTSYYLDEIPTFFNDYINSTVSWPAIGPPVLEESLLQNIPARERWFTTLQNKSNLKSNFTTDKITLKKDIVIYPNPSENGFLTLKMIDQYKSCDIKIYSVDGQLVFKKDTLDLYNNNNNKSMDIDVSNLTRGVYLVSVILTDKIITEKIIVK